MSTPYYITDSTYNVAVDCNAVNKKISNGECIDNCPNGTATLQRGIECINWKQFSMFNLNNVVVTVCPYNYFYDSNNICILCSNYIYNNQCLNQCPNDYAVELN